MIELKSNMVKSTTWQSRNIIIKVWSDCTLETRETPHSLASDHTWSKVLLPLTAQFIHRFDDVWTGSMIPSDNLILHRLMQSTTYCAYRVCYSLCPRSPQCSWSHESKSHLESNIFIDLWPSFLSPSPHCAAAAQPTAKVYLTQLSS